MEGLAESEATPAKGEDASVSAVEQDFKKPVFSLPAKKKLGPSAITVAADVPIKPPEPPIKERSKEKLPPLPYTEPDWGGEVATQSYSFEILKNGTIVEQIALNTKSFYVFGRLSNCDIQMNHPSTSRYHAVLQYRSESEADNPKGFYIYDLKSTHGTFMNKQKLKPEVFAPVRVGHMLQIGGSTRMLILQGPEEDEEPESPFTVTELIQQKREKELEKQRMEALRLAEEKAMEEKRKIDEENAGIDWGMGEDADEETDLTENPYASTNNEELYLTDPKKSLRGWFEREGEELAYDCQERTSGQFVCRVVLPVDDAGGRPLIAEAMVRGKKKEAVVQCALEACRLLDRQGLFRKATHEARSKKKKNWDEEGDSDDDTFLDRTGAVELKRQRKLDGKSAQKAQTYESLVEELEKVRERISETQLELEQSEKSAELISTQKAEQDELDAFMSTLSKDTTQDKIKRRAAKTQLLRLQQDEKRLVRLANIARPASLPELKVQEEVPEVSKKAAFVGSRPAAKSKSTASTSSAAPEPEPEAVSYPEGEEVEEEEEEDVKEVEKTESITDCEPESNAKRKLGPSIPAEMLAKYYEVEYEDDEDLDEDYKGPKRQRVRTRHNKSNTEKSKVKTHYDDESGDYSTWVPPKDQKGDGRTKLNDKLGY
ncbi:kanadaptin [Cloeon dipterum]|uniref:kanadaptin n=1 Tax=Cloeon dipterum TaxID=197152 RepID=UPI00322031D5